MHGKPPFLTNKKKLRVGYRAMDKTLVMTYPSPATTNGTLIVISATYLIIGHSTRERGDKQ